MSIAWTAYLVMVVIFLGLYLAVRRWETRTGPFSFPRLARELPWLRHNPAVRVPLFAYQALLLSGFVLHQLFGLRAVWDWIAPALLVATTIHYAVQRRGRTTTWRTLRRPDRLSPAMGPGERKGRRNRARPSSPPPPWKGEGNVSRAGTVRGIP